MGLVAGGRGGAEEKEEEEKKKEKIPHMCESIGHRPLRGRCPKSIQNARFTSFQPVHLYNPTDQWTNGQPLIKLRVRN